MERTLYGFNSSQDVIHLQTKYTFFKRVANIVFQTVVESGFDKPLMTKAINLLIERNDCLRISFVKERGAIKQYFVSERSIGKIPFRALDTQAKVDSFYRNFRRRMLNPFKGEVLKVAFASNPNGKDVIYFKISHYVADSYAIGLLVKDLFAIYNALKNNGALPAPNARFEDVLIKDMEYKDNDDATSRDMEFFKDYYENRHPQHPVYCGLHGNGSDRWLKLKRQGKFYCPYLFIKCNTQGYKLTIPSAVEEKVEKWCAENNITMSAFFFYAMALTTSLMNGRERHQAPLQLLDCRGTLTERKCGGTKVQALSVYTSVDYERSFNENIAQAAGDQSGLFRHTKLSYLGLEKLQHKLWNFPITSQVISFCYSFIPYSTDDNVNLTILSNGKGSLVAYVALMYNMRSHKIDVAYDVQTEMISAEQLMDFHNNYLNTIETVLARPDKSLETIFPLISE